jgi:hypothetical protein
MKQMDFVRFEQLEEQVYRAGELFDASPDNPYRPEMMQILRSAEKALDEARRRVGLNVDRVEPLPWWVEWRDRQSAKRR